MNKCKFSKCNLKDCDYANRHFRVKDNDKSTSTPTTLDDLDPKVAVFSDIMDSLHYYLFHLFDTGFRSTPRVPEANTAQEKQGSKYKESYDPELARIRKMISSKRGATDRFNRISSSKFIIEASSQHTSEIETDGTTYLDTVFEQLPNMKISDDAIMKLYHYLQQQVFDTEAVDLDLSLKDGNIVVHMENHRHCIDALHWIFSVARRMFPFCIAYLP